MALFWSIWAFFAFYLYKDFHKAFLAYCVFSIFMIGSVCLKYSPPALALSVALQIQIFIMYWKKLHMRKNPLKSAIIFFIFVHLISIVFSKYPIIFVIPGVLQSILPLIVMLIFMKEFSFERDFKYIHKCFLISSVVFIGYGLIEYILQSNPVLTWQNNMMPEEYALGKMFQTQEDNIRMGSIRCQSFFSHSIAYGSICVMYILYYTYVLYKFSFLSKKIRIITMTMIPLLLFGMITSGSRSPIIGLVVGISGYLSLSAITRKPKIFLGLFCVLLSAYSLGFIDVMIELVSSIFVKNSNISGSSQELRILQLITTFQCISSNPIFGLGAKGMGYAFYTLKAYNLAGCESIWYQLLLNMGLIGAFAYLYLSIQMFKISKINGSYFNPITSFVICFFGINSMTSIPAFSISHYFVVFWVVFSSTYCLNKYAKRSRLNNNASI